MGRFTIWFSAVLLSAGACAAAPGAPEQPQAPAAAPAKTAATPVIETAAVRVPTDAEFRAWVAKFKEMARAKGISAKTIDSAMARAAYIPRVIELDRRQPEFTLTFWQYFDRAISDARVARGREMLKKHGALLDGIHKKYGVQPRFLVSFWGLESNFGDHTGTFSLVGSLATLAFDDRRSRFFTEQLLAALEVMDRGDIAVDAKGSWAGAMGNTQFIPTTYRAYAVDGDGDGRRDLWGSLPDVFASSAHYLAKSGWDKDHTWGREVRLPEGFEFGLSGLDTKLKIKEWQAKGVRRTDGGDLPPGELEASLILPAGAAGPAFLVYQNFRTTLVWNRSILYALAVGHLADRLEGAGPLKAQRPSDDASLSRGDMKEIQRLLTEKGFDTGGADGIAGPATRKAIRSYQAHHRLPPDGHAGAALLRHLRGAQN